MKRWMGWFLVIGLVSCDLGDLGQLVAKLDVEATLTENSCGAAVGTIPARTAMKVDVYERDGMITWVSDQGTFQASVDDEGNFVMEISGQALLRDEEITWDGVIQACVVTQEEEIRGKLVRGIVDPTVEDAERVPAAVTATDTLYIAPVSGADCSDLVGTNGFSTLPCRVVMDLEGTETEGAVYE